MRAVKSRGNKSTELRLIQLFRKFNIKGWRRHYNLLGNPDFTFPKIRTVVFCDGCFWHGHKCKKTGPKSNAEYWKEKIRRNRERDRLVTKILRQKGWRVIRIWECEIKTLNFPRKLQPLLS